MTRPTLSLAGAKPAPVSTPISAEPLWRITITGMCKKDPMTIHFDIAAPDGKSAVTYARTLITYGRFSVSPAHD